MIPALILKRNQSATSTRDPTSKWAWIAPLLRSSAAVIRRCCSLSLSLGFTFFALLSPACANLYDDAIQQVRAISDSPNVRLLPFGKSAQGRSIPAFLITDFSSNSVGKARVMIISGQHGDEPNPISAVLKLCNDLAGGSNQDMLKGCIIIVAPTVNPDGIAVKNRYNSQGIDINRDWIDRQTAEARYVHCLIRHWRPQVILDVHEWTGPSQVPGNGIEVAYVSRSSQSNAMLVLGKRIAQSSGLTLIQVSSHSNKHLFHRRYSDLGYASFLLETAPGESRDYKFKAYISAIEQAAQEVAGKVKLREQLSPSSASFNATAVSSYLEPAAKRPFADPEASAIMCVSLVVAAYCVLMWILKPLAAIREIKWSRRFLRCSIEWDDQIHPLLKKRRIEPITSRSWARRRIRSRYADSDSVSSQSEPAGLLF
ncbi:MAG: DUF2817 domain-containing protein [Armatimonadetes bacterium]|nr:DUF2817 domain-containing protein [Armatimonadota bacterium]